MHTPATPVALLLLALAACSADPLTAPPDAADPALRRGTVFPDVIALPDGFWPEGIAFGRGTTFHVGSLATGAIWRGDARTGSGALLVGPQPGQEIVGLAYDARGDRLLAAGGFTGRAFVYDASSGATLATYQLADAGAGPTLINDVVVTRDAAWFTDSFRPVLYRLPLGANGEPGAPGAVETIALGGDFVHDPSSPVGNANGIAATPDGRHLLVVNTATGALYRVDPETGHATEIALGGERMVEGDGLLLQGRTLYVVQGALNRVAVVRLDADLASGALERVVTDPDLAFPSTIAAHGDALYAVNARFDVAPGPGVAYQVVRIAR